VTDEQELKAAKVQKAQKDRVKERALADHRQLLLALQDAEAAIVRAMRRAERLHP